MHCCWDRLELGLFRTFQLGRIHLSRNTEGSSPRHTVPQISTTPGTGSGLSQAAMVSQMPNSLLHSSSLCVYNRQSYNNLQNLFYTPRLTNSLPSTCILGRNFLLPQTLSLPGHILPFHKDTDLFRAFYMESLPLPLLFTSSCFLWCLMPA